MMGSCSQHDILFDKLSVEEHLRLFFMLKSQLNPNSNQQELEGRIDWLLKTVKLDRHRDFESQALSGGMRRRLSIALALASPSDSSIVILDEPTTGLDAMVREEVWQLIKSLKHGRCIVMTTQHLQEAEELADKIALLDAGKMVAKGTVTEIKRKFGIGYCITIGRADDEQAEIDEAVLRMVPGSIRDTDISAQKCKYILPFQQVDQFSDFFKWLEDRNLKFSLKQTSLEDAFINFTNLNSASSPGGGCNEDPEALSYDFDAMDSNAPASRCSLFCLQFKAMFLKRWYSFKRDWRMWLIMVLPSLLIFLFLLVGFQREYVSSELQYSSELIGKKGVKNTTELNSTEIGHALTNLNELHQISDLNSLFSRGNGSAEGPQKYFKSIMENPSMDNILSNLVSLSQDESDVEELKEIKELMNEIMHEDLEIGSPMELFTYGLKLMGEEQEKRD